MSRRVFAFLAVVAAISLSAYLWAAASTYRMGFPLDDAWIHQTYARSLALRGEWSFLPGRPSAGSTAPLWSLLLAFGPWTGLGPYIWTFVLGWAALLGISLVGYQALQVMVHGTGKWAAAAALFLGLEWHLAWAAGSGMETLAYALLAAVVLFRMFPGRGNPLLSGLLIGLGVWLRPDALTLLGPAVLSIWLESSTWREKSADFVRLFAGAGLLVTPYLLFNLALAGQIMPNTFFAKQAEYAVVGQTAITKRLLDQLVLPLVGAGSLLLPGFIFFVSHSVASRRWEQLLPPAWFLGYAGLYAWRLPLVYQHGRYLIPAMPVYFICGLIGMVWWLQGLEKRRASWVISRAWVISLAALLLVFWGIGAGAYGRDVAIIESEMVETARWVEENTPPEDLVAAHDIGALGYFAGRDLLDLAGLVSPEVIPFIRDESMLEAYLDEKGANYLVTLEGWYPQLEAHSRLVFITGAAFSPAAGGTNMVVYRWLDDGP